jgi:hypothetical protein
VLRRTRLLLAALIAVVGTVFMLFLPITNAQGEYGIGHAGGVYWRAHVSPSYYLVKCGIFYDVRFVVSAPALNESGGFHPGFQGWHCSGPFG